MYEGGLVAPPALVWRMGCAWHQYFALHLFLKAVNGGGSYAFYPGCAFCVCVINVALFSLFGMWHYDP